MVTCKEAAELGLHRTGRYWSSYWLGRCPRFVCIHTWLRVVIL